jgi:hypothetical protein
MKAKDKISDNRNLEIVLWTFALTIFLMLFMGNAKASTPPQFEEEEYIDDIPFNTELVVHRLTLPDIDFEEEATIEDIPFNTAEIAMMTNFRISMETVFNMEEEEKVNDIPFDTGAVAGRLEPIMTETVAKR